MFGIIFTLSLRPVMPSWKMLHLRCLTGFEFAFVATDYFRNTIGYLFTKFN